MRSAALLALVATSGCTVYGAAIGHYVAKHRESERPIVATVIGAAAGLALDVTFSVLVWRGLHEGSLFTDDPILPPFQVLPPKLFLDH